MPFVPMTECSFRVYMRRAPSRTAWSPSTSRTKACARGASSPRGTIRRSSSAETARATRGAPGGGGIVGFAVPSADVLQIELAARDRAPFEAIEELVTDWPELGS
jgi:hypothetical protein